MSLSRIIRALFSAQVIDECVIYSKALISRIAVVALLVPSVEIERIGCNCGYGAGYIQDMIAVSLNCVDCYQYHFLGKMLSLSRSYYSAPRL